MTTQFGSVDRRQQANVNILDLYLDVNRNCTKKVKIDVMMISGNKLI